MTPSTALIICARAPRRVLPVPAVRELTETGRIGRDSPAVENGKASFPVSVSSWRCSWCGARIKVVA